MEENKWKNKCFLDALKNSFAGIKYIFNTSRNFKIQSFFAIMAIILGIILKINIIECLILVLTIFFVLVLEFLNTAIENVVDMYTLEYNEKAKIIKDVSAGAVTLTAITSIIIGCIIFLPKIIAIL